MNNIDKYIAVNKEIAGGVPVFRGTRVAVKTLFDYLEEESLEDFRINLFDSTGAKIDVNIGIGSILDRKSNNGKIVFHSTHVR